jgi:ABC-2 type transport system ATP-binding protein
MKAANGKVEKVVEVYDLKKYYKDVKAVDGISFHVRKGQVFTLLGPNGAGKTTTLEILEGLKQPDSGEMVILGQPCKKVTAKMKDRYGILLQENQFINKIKVSELISLFSTFFTRSLPLDQILEQITLKDKANAFVEALSGGQKQRLAIGLALVNDPEIIFMDEPTTGLDPQARRNVWELINTLREQGKSIFLTTHNMEEAEQLSDYVYVMDHGKIIANGTPKTLIQSIGKEKVIEFEKRDLSEASIDNLKTRFDHVSVKGEVIHIYEEDLTACLPTLLAWAQDNRFEMANLAFRQPNLEDVFLALTGKGLRD